jgi:hypothetical protein
VAGSDWIDDEDDEEGEELDITSEQAYVAAATVACFKCRAQIEVICIYCESGVVSEEPLEQFTVSGIYAVDDALGQQLKSWPFFRYIEEKGYFANYCPHCDAEQDDMFLHSEPDQVFFSVPRAAAGTITLIELVGKVQLGGSESFEV